MILIGVPSGDGECWCFLVDKKTFTAVTGKAPDKEFNVGRNASKGSRYRYMLYPDHLIPEGKGGKLIALSVDSKVLEGR
jgi:hypothetical protein